jgi:CRP/FNR family cyclic AMP-dependent transcriptional regulator
MARGNQAYLDHLKKVALFSACNNKELQRIARSGTEIKVPDGYKLTDQGQLGNQAFVVMEGTVTVKRNNKKVAQLGPGTMVGELSLLDHGPRTATVTTDGDATVFVIDQRSFMAVLDDVPALSHKLLSALAGRIRDFDRQYYG